MRDDARGASSLVVELREMGSDTVVYTVGIDACDKGVREASED
jgi:hypothetical protein